MLHHLRVRNLGVLEDAVIDPSEGFTVITGETGAGKTLLLGGLRLVFGEKADSGSVGPFKDEAQVDALFVVGSQDLGVSRIIPREGRSRAYLEGGIVSAETLGTKVGQGVEIVGQHDQLTLTRAANLLSAIDNGLDSEGTDAREVFQSTWDAYRDLMNRRRDLGGDPQALARELDLARYQAMEIEKSSLIVDLDHEIEAELSKLRNVEEITETLAATLANTSAMFDGAGEVVSSLRKVSGLDQTAGELTRTAEGLMAEIQELANAVRTTAEGLAQDPERLQDLEARLNAIGDLKRKYGRTLAEVIEFGETAGERVRELEALVEESESIDQRVGSAMRHAELAAGELSRLRLQAVERIAKDMTRHLGDLGLPEARIDFDLQRAPLSVTGHDRIELLFASDRRLEPGPIASVASGGELSRLVLALRLAVRVESATTLVFDEVDTGIGGTTALAMGHKLAELAKTSQVLCVTHLAQVAAHADRQYAISREGGVATVRLVGGEHRVAEIARMLAGQPDSAADRTVATELLASSAGR